ncbi:MAG: hypothetical protein K2W96_01425 [Gemmataceae bacterium]|nr:hypothetical protein [Gemmataceae bacterium]
MGQFDQTGRQMAKLDGAQFLAWALSCCEAPPALSYFEWEDTRRLVVPGEPDLVNDAVMKVEAGAHDGLDCWLITEIEDEAEQGIFIRVGKYEMALLAEVSANLSVPVGVLSLVVNLTGRQEEPELASPFGGWGTRIKPLVVDVAEQDAVKTLERIERGELGLTVLPFCALMRGAGEPAFIERWKLAVMQEPDEVRRRLYRDWAMVMVELTRWQIHWQQATEGWMERKSMLIEGWLGEGREQGAVVKARSFLLKALGRLQNPVPAPLRDAVEGSNDVGKLEQWFDAALAATDLADFRSRMNL